VGLIVDTSLFVAGERGKFDLQAFFDAHPRDDLSIATLAASELSVGVHRASPDRRQKRAGLVEDWLARFQIVPFDLETARLHAALAAELDAKGTKVGAHDLIIAATALRRGDAVATRDARSFPRVPGLKVELL
jgi:predicted nucleic acid-binding protein